MSRNNLVEQKSFMAEVISMRLHCKIKDRHFSSVPATCVQMSKNQNMNRKEHHDNISGQKHMQCLIISLHIPCLRATVSDQICPTNIMRTWGNYVWDMIVEISTDWWNTTAHLPSNICRRKYFRKQNAFFAHCRYTLTCFPVSLSQ